MITRKHWLFSLLIAGVCWPAASVAGGPKGSLIIIGGGNRAGITARFVALAGGPENARIIVIPNASGEPEADRSEMVPEFHALGVRDVELVFLNREQASDPKSVHRLDGATGIFFTGGDQARITSALRGTPFHAKMMELYAAGTAVAGTSAGAAMMSEVMITGDERLNSDTTRNFFFIKKNNVITLEGMGFLTNAIIDQHFATRKRHNRLISVVLEHPRLVGFGIDESTALIVTPDSVCEVAGQGTVIVYDATRAKNVRVESNGNLAGDDLLMHVLVAGDRYDMAKRAVIRTTDH